MDVNETGIKLRSYWTAFDRKYGPASEAQRHAFACGFRDGIKAQKELTDEWRQFKAEQDEKPTEPPDA